MADPTRRQIAMMADEVGIIDHAAACKLVRRAFEVSRSARAALAADEPAVQSREPASVADEPSDEELLATLDKATADFPPRHPEAEALNAVEYPLALELRKARAVIAADRARWGHQPAPPAGEEVAELVAAVQAAYSAHGWVDEKQFARLFDEVARLASVIEERCDCSVYGPINWKAEIELLRQSQPTPPAEGEVGELVAEIRHFLAGYRQIRGLDPEYVYSIHRGDAMEAHIRISRLARAADLLAQRPEPVPVAERLPEPNIKVLAHYFNDLGKGRTICAIWVPTKTRSDSYGDDDFTEYDEESDTFYWPEGWYEAIENWDDLGYVKVDEGEVIYWQPLPKWPATALPLPAGEVE